MRLLNTGTLRLTLFSTEPLPDYATLSHRWGDDEISLQGFEERPSKDHSILHGGKKTRL